MIQWHCHSQNIVLLKNCCKVFCSIFAGNPKTALEKTVFSFFKCWKERIQNAHCSEIMDFCFAFFSFHFNFIYNLYVCQASKLLTQHLRTQCHLPDLRLSSSYQAGLHPSANSDLEQREARLPWPCCLHSPEPSLFTFVPCSLISLPLKQESSGQDWSCHNLNFHCTQALLSPQLGVIAFHRPVCFTDTPRDELPHKSNSFWSSRLTQIPRRAQIRFTGKHSTHCTQTLSTKQSRNKTKDAGMHIKGKLWQEEDSASKPVCCAVRSKPGRRKAEVAGAGGRMLCSISTLLWK